MAGTTLCHVPSKRTTLVNTSSMSVMKQLSGASTDTKEVRQFQSVDRALIRSVSVSILAC